MQKRVRLAVMVSVLAVVAAGCSPGKRSKKSDNPTPAAGQPLYEKELTLDFPPNPKHLLEAKYRLVGVAIQDPDFEIKAYHPTTKKELSPKVFDIPGLESPKQADGTYNHILSVKFRVTPESIGGMIIRVTAKNLKEGDKPLVMETRFKLSNNAYVAHHQSPESIASDMAVLREDAFPGMKKEEATLENVLRLALSGTPGVNHAANADLEKVASAWRIEEREGETVFVQLAPAALVVSYPGKATIEQNGFPLLLQGDKWGAVTVRVSPCGRPIDNPLCKGKPAGDYDLIIATMEAPKVETQTITEAGQTLRATDGVPGRTSTADEVRKMCEEQIPRIEGIPRDRAICTDLSKWHGKNLQLHLNITRTAIMDLEVKWKDYRDNLILKDDPEKYKLLDGKGAPCSDNSCVFGFDQTKVIAENGQPRLSPDMESEFKMRGENDLLPAFDTGRIVAAEIDRAKASFDFQNTTWTQGVGGAREVWELAAVREWADKQCDDAVVAEKRAWTAGKALPAGLDSYAPDAPREVEERGIDTREANLSDASGMWAITDTKATTNIKSDSNSGSSTFELFLKDPETGMVLGKDSIAVQNETMHLSGKGLELLRPLAGRIEVEGTAGGNGYDTPRVAAFIGGDIREQIAALTGRAGPKGKSTVYEGFQPGKLEPLAYITTANGTIKSNPGLFGKIGTTDPCTDIMSGECEVMYFPTEAIVTDQNDIRLTYATRPIVATYNLPWRGLAGVTGSAEIALKQALTMPGIENILGFSEAPGNHSAAGRDNAFGLAEARKAGTRSNGTSAQAAFWGQGEREDFNGFGSKLKKKLKKGWKGAAVVTNPVVGVAAIVLDKGTSKIKEWSEDMSPIIHDELQSLFSGKYKNPSTGRHEIKAPNVIKAVEPSKEVQCSNVPGVGALAVNPSVKYKPEYVNARFDHLLRGDDASRLEVERPLALQNAQAKLVETLNPILDSYPEFFRNIRTTCDEDKCYTDLDVVVKIDQKKKCKDFGSSCTTERKEHTLPGRILWFSDQNSVFLAEIRDNCRKEEKTRVGDLKKLAIAVTTGAAKPAVHGLGVLSRETRSSLAKLAGMLATPAYQTGYWEIAGLAPELKSVLQQDALASIYSAVRNLKRGSAARSALEGELKTYNFEWSEVGRDGDLREELKLAKKNHETLPSETDIREIELHLGVIARAMAPKARALTCSVTMDGFFKAFVNAKTMLGRGLDLAESPSIASVKLGRPTYQSFQTRIHGGKKLDYSSVETDYIKIPKFNLSPIKDKIILTTTSTSIDGKKVDADYQRVPSCGSLGRVSVETGMPIARFMFQEAECGENRSN